MTIGLPYSGKSRAVKELAKQEDEIIERDTILQEVIDSLEFRKVVAREGKGLRGNELFAVRNRIAIEMLSERVREKVRQCTSERIFYDGTNLQRAARAGILAMRHEGVRVKALMFAVPLDEILNRAVAAAQSEERKGAFNERAIQSLVQMSKMAEDPSMDEGFSEIEVRRFEPEHREGQEARR